MSDNKFPDAVYVDGKVVLWYFQPMPKAIQIGSKITVFTPEHGVSLALVDEADVQSLLDFKGGCCGRKRQVVHLATPTLYSHWKDGKGGR